MKRFLRGFFSFIVVAVLVTGILVAVTSSGPMHGPSLAFLALMVAFLAVVPALVWPWVLRLSRLLGVRRPLFDILAGGLIGVSVTFLLGPDAGGLRVRVAFLFGFAVAAIVYWYVQDKRPGDQGSGDTHP